jgi:hypothetical protein
LGLCSRILSTYNITKGACDDFVSVVTVQLAGFHFNAGSGLFVALLCSHGTQSKSSGLTKLQRTRTKLALETVHKVSNNLAMMVKYELKIAARPEEIRYASGDSQKQGKFGCLSRFQLFGHNFKRSVLLWSEGH